MNWKERFHEIIFEADTPAGKAFDVALLIAICMSIFSVMLESVSSIEEQFGVFIRNLEWIFTILFTIEYILRIIIIKKPLKYIFSFMGLVDLLAIIPTYLSIIITGTHSLLIIRTIRLLRVFRIFKLAHFVGEAGVILDALKASRAKLTVFLGSIITIVIIMGTVMYMVEGGENGFTSIPRSIYWAIVTLTTVGYGDIAPRTVPGQAIASIIMILGYSIIAVPTGIVSSAITRSEMKETNTQNCPNCSKEGHDNDATHCKFCGENL